MGKKRNTHTDEELFRLTERAAPMVARFMTYQQVSQKVPISTYIFGKIRKAIADGVRPEHVALHLQKERTRKRAERKRPESPTLESRVARLERIVLMLANHDDLDEVEISLRGGRS